MYVKTKKQTYPLEGYKMIWFQVGILLMAILMPLLLGSNRAEAALLGNRELKMSSSANGSIADGQDVTYEFHFDYTSTTNIASVEFDFCSESPIVGDTCTGPTGFDVNEGAGLTLANETNETGYSIHANTDTNTICITRTPEAVTAATDSEYEFTGIDNPENTNTTFYVRLQTFASTDCTGSSTDEGGIAVSTAEQIILTAKVQEELTFCIYESGNSCGSPGNPDQFTIGGGANNNILSSTVAYHNADGRFDASTNANGGLTIRMTGETLCKSSTVADCDDTPVGSEVIDAIGSTATASSAGTEQFGMCVITSGGSVTPTAPYNDANCGDDVTTGTYTGSSTFAFDDNSTTGTNETYGDTIASSTATSTTTTGTLNFLANVDTTTEPGTYTATLTFIATGVF